MKNLFAAFLLIFSLSAAALAVSPNVNPSATAETKSPKLARPFLGQLFGAKVLVGTMTGVADKIITVTQKDGASADITTTEVTKYLKGGRAVSLSSLVNGDQIFALGATSIDGTFIAKSIVAKSKILKDLKKFPYFGSVSQVANSSFTVKNLMTGDEVEIMVNGQTLIKQNGKKILLTALAAGQRVVVIALKEDDGSLIGQMVVVLPTKPLETVSQ